MQLKDYKVSPKHNCINQSMIFGVQGIHVYVSLLCSVKTNSVNSSKYIVFLCQSLWWLSISDSLKLLRWNQMTCINKTGLQRKYIVYLSSWSQYCITYVRKPRPNPAQAKRTMTLTHSEELNASKTTASHDRYHKTEKMEPTTAPTRIWFIVWSFCDTRSHDCKPAIRLDAIFTSFRNQSFFLLLKQSRLIFLI